MQKQGIALEFVSTTNVCSGSPCINGGKCVRDKHTYLCTCPEFWMGYNCAVENEPAIRYKSAAVALGTAFGVITAILLIALLAIFVRTVTGKKRMLRTGSQKYRCRSVKEDELSKTVAALEVANTSGQHQSPDNKNDKPKDVVSIRPVSMG
ncbi:hypothetical protein LSAT2_019657 [Lamellibrachia satsuma]|nr:hypothetical protein LSAT2_019657 [Lamellibrachia satsuma]